MSGCDKMKSRREILIVDGYNVLRCGSGYSHLKTPDWTDDYFNFARDTLINDVAFFCGSKMDATVVFDATDNRLSQGNRTKVGGVDIIFSKTGMDADQTIINLAVKAREKGASVTVVSSDASVQNSVMGHGVARMSANDFCKECKGEREEQASDEIEHTKATSTVKSRVDASSLEKLLAIRDGK